MSEAGRLQPPFVGDGRQKVVEGLAALLAQAQLQERPIWVSIEAPSGWGKTRVAHAFYERLARQQAKIYWPHTILDATDASFFDVASRRKRVFPEPRRFDREAGALPEYFWWGIACEMRSGAPTQVLLQDLAQLEAHALFLEAAWGALASAGEKYGLTLDRARDMASALAEEAVGEGIGKLAEKLLGAAVPGLGLGLDLAKLGFGKARETWETRQLVAQPGAMPAAGPDIVTQAAETLIRLARPGLPIILFVEDLHRDTGLVGALIGQLLASDAPIMILTTTWPGEIERSQDLAALLADPAIADRILRLQHNVPVPAPFPDGASMDALPADALKQLIRAYYPATDEAVLGALAARYNNPLPIELICTLDRHRRAGQDGVLRLSADEIEKLPRKVEQLYRQLWGELPYPVQCVLALSTLAIPSRDASWHRRLVQSAVAAVAARIAEPGAPASVGGPVPHGWVREIETWLRRFNEPDQMRIARQEVEDRELFGDDVIDDFLAALAAAVVETPLLGALRASEEDQHRAWLALSLHPAGLIDDDVALDAVLLLLRSLSDGPGDIRLKLSLAPILAAIAADTADERLFEARDTLALSFAQGAGRMDEAIAMFEAILADRRAINGEDHPATAASASQLMMWLHYVGQRERAIAIQRQILASERRRLGDDDPATIISAAMLANHLHLSLHNAEAIEIYTDVLPRLRDLLGDDHDRVVSARRDLARALATPAKDLAPDVRERQLHQAIAVNDALIADFTRRHGPDSHEVALQRVQRMEVFAEYRSSDTGWVDGAIEDALALIDDLRRSDDDNGALVDRTRRSLSWILWRSERLGDFVARQSERLDEVLSNMPADISVAWTVLEDAIYWFEDAAPLEEKTADQPVLRDWAIELRQTLVESRADRLGEDRYDVMAARLELIGSLLEAGRLDEAQALHRDFLASPHRDARDGWNSLSFKRQSIGEALADAGLAEEGIVSIEALQQDEERSSDPSVETIEQLRYGLARAHAKAQDTSAAIAVYRALLAEQRERYGPTGHQFFVTTDCLAQLLPADEAIALWRALRDERRAELGDDHPLVAEVQDRIDAAASPTIH